ncbi:PREDICTED: acyl-CoA Delta(11) desaturase [Dinoponera quadriceps]|uniref:Acyl-CoA Delta(11) desaturase n=1 Tax=Dinoponera quadriceps TaxID=609295 RepID=A0A6P3X1B1_DINQU|nr:PREDICTED: acyl-CoA Delta(11) desaturase [Dinoponera quadriceps]XP_014472083.1 PREDICTED: acyl-CoA Delta(11) desaturase [Dinoponera quadriceps]XP_014472084.1 PREDICTED: acyl-CoA Delta(11) desaturase [Dinoponera quadriceps]XP_014472085.1 PREDICTED: acyl-CoA Delta(11) desaturase [Dinoponera quadriceps]XP_014472086.1 PREDICTED: acyl-CoA Delta(11) desaturase [Dinoponera quadriceps]XP_014472087.1 PREDICTED: acyl-CoA Delta(11) desaturase [Dinoponera quadriceps]XP_014472088.1 PREDICTED: acyl-CoA 
MAPNTSLTPTGVLFEGETLAEPQLIDVSKEKPKYVRRIVWRNVLAFSYLHIASLYGLYLAFTSAKWATVFFAILLYQSTALGITAGAHRLWAHRSYKAKWPLQLFLMIMNTIAFQDAAIDWARDHRVHHKFSETDADPHNAKRGFFFSHVGWLLCRKHPDVKEKGKGIDLSDLESDPILAFQKKYYTFLMPLLCFIMPTVIPVFFWDETWSNAYFVPTILRYTFTLNMTWLVNSAAHMFGNKPYDKYINPSENKGVALMTFGEGWHNYHHVFPWDYRASEFGYRLNFTTMFIDFCAKIGWVYDMKSVSEDMVMKRVERTGDGSHELWGWGDKDQTQEERDEAVVKYNCTKDQ